MKSKYFLRGMGLGIIITALIFLIANLVINPATTDEEIRERAKNLGMVSFDEIGADEITEKKEEGGTSGEKEENENPPESASSSDLEEYLSGVEDDDEEEQTTVSEENTFTPEEIEVTLYQGETSRLLSEDLKEKGLIDDSESFDRFLESKGFAPYLQTGVYKIKTGSSFDEIAHIITKNKIP